MPPPFPRALPEFLSESWLIASDAAIGRLTHRRRDTSRLPAHPLLAPLIEHRTKGKRPDDYLFEDLPEQAPGSKRDRSAPVSQSFTRERRRLGIEEKGSDKQSKSNMDFHSWRPWFIRRAVTGLERGTVGYDVNMMPAAELMHLQMQR